MLNPDGVNLVQNGPDTVLDRDALSRIRMVVNAWGGWKSNINGVDLNQNYPAEWRAKWSAARPSSEGFKGVAPATEPEVQAMMSYSSQNHFLIAASLHTKGEVIYWADRRTHNLIPEQRQIAQVISNVTGYKLLQVSHNPGIYAGGFENWFRAEFRRTALCIELTPPDHTRFPHNDANFDALVWNKAKYIGAALAAESLKLEAVPVQPSLIEAEVNGNSFQLQSYRFGRDDYFKLRDIAYIMNGTAGRFDVGHSSGTILLRRGVAYTATGFELINDGITVMPPESRRTQVAIDGETYTLTTFLVGGSNYARLCDIVKLLGAHYERDETAIKITI
jgi:hypothetical protein